MQIVVDINKDVFLQVMSEVKTILEMENRATCDSRTIQTSVRLILPGELAKHAVSEVRVSLTSTGRESDH